MNRRIPYLLPLLLTCATLLPAQTSPPAIDLDRVLTLYPERVKRLFADLNLERPELRGVRAHLADGDYSGACRALLAYYRNNTNFSTLRRPDAIEADLREAGRILADTLTFQGLRARQLRRPDGGIDWTYQGPRNDAEWANFLNRHEWCRPLLDAYRQTGDDRYAERLNDLLLDWALANPLPVAEDYAPPWHPLNTAIRFSTWPELFYGLQQSEAFSDATRLLMLISIQEQAAWIQRFHWTHQNHALFELNGLARIAVYWPEFRQAADWLDYAATHMLYEMEGQVLPDGVQDELTSMYHYYALQLFQELMDLATVAGKSLPAAFRKGVEKMYDYLAYTMRPDGYNVLNNDSDLSDYRTDIARAARVFNRPDWAYIISNGEQGEVPPQTSVLFPYAGQVILRNGWDRNAHWSYFDAGPYGTAHRHDDKLHLSVAAYGRDLLVDGGRYWYNADIWREYFVSSYSHNVVLIDGFGHRPDVNRYDTPNEVVFETNDTFAYAQATFDAGFREVDDQMRHTRGVLYLKDHFWIVIDHLSAAKPHTMQALWHFHPDCRVETDGRRAYSNDPGVGNLLIVPATPAHWKVDLRFGPDTLAHPETFREWKPRSLDEFPIQGAYSPRYNEKKANYVAVYNGRLAGAFTGAWVLVPFPAQPRPGLVRARLKQHGSIVTVKVRTGKTQYRATVDLKSGKVKAIRK